MKMFRFVHFSTYKKEESDEALGFEPVNVTMVTSIPLHHYFNCISLEMYYLRPQLICILLFLCYFILDWE